MGSQSTTAIQMTGKRDKNPCNMGAVDTAVSRSSRSAEHGYIPAGAVSPTTFAAIPVVAPEDRGSPGQHHSPAAAPSTTTGLPPAVHYALRSPGDAIPPGVRRFMEPRFGQDFSHVRVHTDSTAAATARQIGARAYTVGRNVVFGEGQFILDRPGGYRLIAHELAHVIQQGSLRGHLAPQPFAVSSTSDAEEAEADRAADEVLMTPVSSGPRNISHHMMATPVTVQRQASSTSTADMPNQPENKITINPVVIADTPSAQRTLQAESDAMMARFPEVWRGYARDWYEANLNALASVPEPTSPLDASAFWQELGTNVFWATVDLAPYLAGGTPVEALVKPLASGAKAVAHGFPGSGGATSGRAAVGAVLAGYRDFIDTKGTRDVFAEVALECTGNPQIGSDSSKQDEQLWQRFAPGIPFDTRGSVLQKKAAETLASWLRQISEQFHAWKARADVVAKARDYELSESASGPFGDPITVIGDIVGIGTPADRFFQMAQKDIPCKFGLVD